MEKFFWAVICLAAMKSIIGFHWPWEPLVKAKKSLRKNLDSVRDKIPGETYNEMTAAIDKIN